MAGFGGALPGNTSRAFYSGFKHTFELCGRVEDWERRVLVGSPSSSFHKGPSDVIKRATEIVKSITQSQGDLIGNGRHTVNDVGRFPVFKVILSADDVTVIAPEAVDCGYEILNVLIGLIVFC